MIAAIYARKSTEQHGADEDAKSVKRQIDNAKAFAKSKGWTVTDYVYSDDAISGAETKKLVNRQRLLASLGTGRRPPFQVLIMRDPSRFSRRDGDEAFGELKAIAKAGIEIWFYGDGQKFAFGTFSENVVGFVRAEMNAEFRRQIATWTSEAMLRKAKAGHVTGGKTFGYDNVRVDGHVERRINAAEAAVVRRIFDLYIKGHGQARIPQILNAERALAPRAQQGRPTGWSPSSVREVLYRDLYRGVLIWGKTKKRDTFGQIAATTRPESQWVRVSVPKARIISEAVWNAAHERLQQARDSYLRSTKGHYWGRPLNGVASKYLLTGLARCRCGANFEIHSRSHGRKRAYFYACSAHYRKGKTVCANGLVMPLDRMDAAVVASLAPLLTPAFTDTVVRKVLTRAAVPKGPQTDQARAAIVAQLTEVRRELGNLVNALARTGALSHVISAIKQREAQQAHLERELAALEHREHVSQIDLTSIEKLARQKVEDWRTVMIRRTPQTRQVLSKMLRDRLVFVPEKRGGKMGYRFEAEGTILKLLRGTVPELEATGSPRSGLGTPILISTRRMVPIA